MIAYIQGTLEEKKTDSIIVETGGIGYEILTSAYVLERLPELHEDVKIVTYMDVKEDSMKLYGFLSSQEKTLFKQLLSVSGVGPKGALSILNQLGPDNLVAAIISRDSKSISKANGVGSKTAQKVVLELRDKVSTEGSIFDMSDYPDVTNAGGSDAVSEAVEALKELGYSGAEAMKMVRKIKGVGDMSVEDIIRNALRMNY